MILVRCFIKQNCNWGPMPLIYLAVRSAGALCPGIVRVLYTGQKKNKKKNCSGWGGGRKGLVLDCYISYIRILGHAGQALNSVSFSKLQSSAHSWGWHDSFYYGRMSDFPMHAVKAVICMLFNMMVLLEVWPRGLQLIYSF